MAFSTIAGNKAVGGDGFGPDGEGGNGWGGGLDVNGLPVVFSSGDELTIDSCTVSDNQAKGGSGKRRVGEGLGGGVSLGGNGNKVINSTIANNTADTGDGMVIYSDKSVVLTHVTVAYNHAPSAHFFSVGGGIEIGVGGHVVLTNSLVALNTADGQPDINALDAVTDDHNLVGAEVGANPATLLGPLQDNGGSSYEGGLPPTRTIAVSSTSNAYQGGVHIPSGDGRIPEINDSVDQRHTARSATAPTAGAFEIHPTTTVVTSNPTVTFSESTQTARPLCN